jgi:hypothetical protein
MKNKIHLWFFLIIVLNSCTETEDKSTIIFKDYLQKEFNSEIPESLHYYILIPKMLCTGCSVNSLAEINKLITGETESHFTFISTNEKFALSELKRVKFYEYDSRGKLDELDLDIANITIVKTRSGKVLFIKPIYADEKRPISEIITF